MKLEKIQELWEEDSVFHKDEVIEASLNIPRLHSKWMNILSNERLILKHRQREMKTLLRIKNEYYRGILDDKTLLENNWEQVGVKILRQDLDMYIQDDEDVQKLQQIIDLQQEKVTFVESVIKQIVNRSFQIKNIIDWQKFLGGDFS